MFARAKAHRDAHIWDAHNYEEFKDIAENKPGFIRGMWCGDQACEDKIKEDLAVTSRCMPSICTFFRYYLRYVPAICKGRF